MAGWAPGYPHGAAGYVEDLKYGDTDWPAGVDKRLHDLALILIRVTEEKYGYKLHPHQCWGYFNREIAGSSVPSYHSKGEALDHNAPQNGRGTRGDIPIAVVQLWESFGWQWGGRWSYTDPMHFEYHGSVASAHRRLKQAQREFGDGHVKLQYKIGGRVFRQIRGATNYIRARLKSGHKGDAISIHVEEQRKQQHGTTHPQREKGSHRRHPHKRGH